MNHPAILQLEDDENDVMFMRFACKAAQLPNPIHTVRDGQEAVDYLSGTGQFADRARFPLPILVLLEAYAADPFRGDRLVGIARYQLVALPCFLLVGTWLSRLRGPAHIVTAGLLSILLALQCLYISRFVDWILVS